MIARTAILVGSILAATRVCAQCELSEHASATPGDRFGFATAVDGDWAFVGAPADFTTGVFSGAVHVFEREGAEWLERGTLTPSDPQSSHFGAALAAEDGRLVVGAPPCTDQNPCGGPSDHGAAYFFERDGDTWKEVAFFQSATPPAQFDRFGFSAAIRGDTALVGDPGVGGRGHVFERRNGTWTRTAVLEPMSPAGFRVGSSVALADNWLVLGGYDDHTPSFIPSNQFVYERVGSSWVLRDEIDWIGHPSELFGVALAMTDNLLFVGANRNDQVGIRTGRVFRYVRSGTSWNLAGSVMGAVEESQFGSALAIVDQRLYVGAPMDDSNGADAGVVHVFSLSFSPLGTLQPQAPQPGEQFGRSVAVSAQHGYFGGQAERTEAFGIPGTAHGLYLGAVDCNGNGTPDLCEVAAGTTSDLKRQRSARRLRTIRHHLLSVDDELDGAFRTHARARLTVGARERHDARRPAHSPQPIRLLLDVPEPRLRRPLRRKPRQPVPRPTDRPLQPYPGRHLELRHERADGLFARPQRSAAGRVVPARRELELPTLVPRYEPRTDVEYVGWARGGVRVGPSRGTRSRRRR